MPKKKSETPEAGRFGQSEGQASQMVHLDSTTVRTFMTDVFGQLAVPAAERATVVDALMEASLAGYNSHGIMRVPVFARGIRQGTMVPGAKMVRLRESTASVYLDAAYGLGPVAATEAVRLASKKATRSGVGCVSVVNGNDVARLGSYLIKPARAGLVALMLVNDAGGLPCVAPWGGVEAFLSTNPIAAGIPWRQESPILIDISTSVVSYGKLKTVAARDEAGPDGWLIDHAGELTADVSTFFASPKKSALLPLGSLVAGYKGFGLSLLVDILAGALSGAGCSTGQANDLDRNGLFVLVIEPELFVSRAQFNSSVDRFVTALKNTQKAPQVNEILIPGERAYRERQQRLEHGIPLEISAWIEIGQELADLGLEEKYKLVDVAQNGS